MNTYCPLKFIVFYPAGKSMLADTEGQTAGATTVFVSPFSNVSSTSCFSFSYVMDQVPSDVSLMVYFYPSSGETQAQLWTISGDQGSSWLTAKIDSGTFIGTGHFELEVTAGSTSAVVGVDDVLYDHCDNHPTTGTGGGAGETSVGTYPTEYCINIWKGIYD